MLPSNGGSVFLFDLILNTSRRDLNTKMTTCHQPPVRDPWKEHSHPLHVLHSGPRHRTEFSLGRPTFGDLATEASWHCLVGIFNREGLV